MPSETPPDSGHISALTKAEDSSSSCENRYQILLDTAMDGFWRVDMKGRLLEVNETYCRMSGYDECELLAMRIPDLEVIESDRDTAAHLQRVNLHGQDRFESQHRRKDGSIYDVEVSVQYRPDEGGYFFAFLRDITDRKRTEEALRESTERFILITDNVPGYVAFVDANTLQYQYVNAAFEKSFGIPRDKITGSHIKELLGEESFQNALPYIEQVRSGKATSYDRVFDLVTGKRWIKVNYNPIFDSDGQVVSIAVLSYDITERMQAIETLHEYKLLLAETEKIGKIGGWEFDIDSRKQVWTEGVYNIHEVALDYEPTVQKGIDFYTPESKQTITEVVQRAIEQGKPFDVELQITTGKGNLRSVHAIGNTDLKQRKVKGFFQDITTRKNAEKAQQKSEALFRDFFESNPVATIITSPSGTVHMINPAFAKGSGFTVEEVVGRTSQELGFWRDPADRQRMVAAIEEYGFIDNLEAIFYPKSGLPLTMLVASRAIEYEGEMRILSSVIDVTTQREAEKSLSKLNQAKSDFISIAAHELRTPLIAVLGYAELLENTVQADISEQQVHAYASIIRSNAEILNRLVNDLTDVENVQLGRSLSFLREAVSLAELLKKATTSFSLKHTEHRFTLTHVNPLPEISHVDKYRVTQVVNNLLDNAVKYSPGGGSVNITTKTDQRQSTISISDQGMGMTSEQVEKIFDRFYRANPRSAQSSGLGLGMYIVKNIIEGHGGEVSVSSCPGIGTTIAFTLPIATEGG